MCLDVILRYAKIGAASEIERFQKLFELADDIGLEEAAARYWEKQKAIKKDLEVINSLDTLEGF